MAKKSKEEASKKPDDLQGLQIEINEFGEITTGVNVEIINAFLDENVEDKKLKEKEGKEQNQ